MLLTVDVGNTNTVLGIFKGEELVRSWRVKTDPRSTADELWLQYGALVRDYKVSALAICSTVPATLRELRTMISDYFADIQVTIVEPGTKTGVPLLVDNPKEIGADRIVNTLAAHTLYGGPAIVVDFGTSTNLDVVSPKGEFLGGALAPGIEISVDALAARAAQLRKVELVRPKNVIGKNTVEALQEAAEARTEASEASSDPRIQSDHAPEAGSSVAAPSQGTDGPHAWEAPSQDTDDPHA